MTDNDKNAFAQIMYGLADNFSASITQEGMRFRYECLSGYDIDQIRRAATHIVKTRKFTKMPTIADFIEAIEGNQEDKAEEQAMKVLEEMRRVGSWSSPSFDDEKTKKIVASLGWGNICAMKESEVKFFVKDFIASYCSESRRQATTQISGNVDGDVKRLLAGITKEISA